MAKHIVEWKRNHLFVHRKKNVLRKPYSKIKHKVEIYEKFYVSRIVLAIPVFLIPLVRLMLLKNQRVRKKDRLLSSCDARV
jgi:hypothetical protein